MGKHRGCSDFHAGNWPREAQDSKRMSMVKFRRNNKERASEAGVIIGCLE